MRITVNDTRLFFDVVGSGLEPAGRTMRKKPTLILLHGGPGADHSIYRPVFDQLSDIVQVVYLDHRGQGRSDPSSPEHWTLAQWADDLRSFCDALEIEAPVVFGHSFGGMVALAYAARHPRHPGKLVLSGTYARQDLAQIAQRFEDVGGDAARDAAEKFWTTPSAETQRTYDRAAVRYYMRRPPEGTDLESVFRMIERPEVGHHFAADEMQRFDLRPYLGRITCPTLVLGGDLDPVCPIEGLEEIANGIPDDLVRFERFSQCSHIFWEDAHDALFRVLREFLLIS